LRSKRQDWGQLELLRSRAKSSPTSPRVAPPSESSKLLTGEAGNPAPVLLHDKYFHRSAEEGALSSTLAHGSLGDPRSPSTVQGNGAQMQDTSSLTADDFRKFEIVKKCVDAFELRGKFRHSPKVLPARSILTQDASNLVVCNAGRGSSSQRAQGPGLMTSVAPRRQRNQLDVADLIVNGAMALSNGVRRDTLMSGPTRLLGKTLARASIAARNSMLASEADLNIGMLSVKSLGSTPIGSRIAAARQAMVAARKLKNPLYQAANSLSNSKSLPPKHSGEDDKCNFGTEEDGLIISNEKIKAFLE